MRVTDDFAVFTECFLQAGECELKYVSMNF